MPAQPRPYDGAYLERATFSDLTALILCASGDALDAIEAYVDDLQTANEQAPDKLVPEAVRFALSRIGNLKGMIAYRRTELAASRIVVEAGRLSEVAAQHRAHMLDELGDPDTKRQRGNAGAYCHVSGVIDGLALALKEFGFADCAERIERERVDDVDLGPSLSGVAGQRP